MLLAFTLIVGSQAFAFSDLPEGESQHKLEELKRMGIISGTGDDRFEPEHELTYAQAIAMLVKGFNLSLDHQGETASHLYDNVPVDAWYAESFTIAAHHGLELPRDIHPNEAVTHAAYVHYLYQALETQGSIPATKRFFMIGDEADIVETYKVSIQTMLNTGLISLDEDQRFNPTKPITRLEAAVLLYDSLSLIRERQEQAENPQQPIPREQPDLPILEEPKEEKPLSIEDDVSYMIEPINEQVNKVVIDWGTKPHSGYGVAITGINFKDGKAIIQYDRRYPEPDHMYLQVITYPKAETFVSSVYTIELEEVNARE